MSRTLYMDNSNMDQTMLVVALTYGLPPFLDSEDLDLKKASASAEKYLMTLLAKGTIGEEQAYDRAEKFYWSQVEQNKKRKNGPRTTNPSG